MPAYLWKRISRVYIPYLPIVAAVIAVYILLPTASKSPREWGWATSLLLIPTASPPALNVAWTLVHEIIFYAIFLLFFVGPRVFLVAVFVWSAAIVAIYFHPIDLPAPMGIILHPINLEFVVGMACAIGYRVLPGRCSVALLAAAAVAMIIYFGGWATEGLRGGLFAIGSALVLLGSALGESTIRPFIPRGLVTLGDASYSIYLIHNPMISVTSRILARLLIPEMWVIAMTLSFVVAVMAGLAYHFLFERPALGIVRASWRKALVG
jgi:exopolysaccharide production protein ExoZ